ncbi:hypothetical protein [Leisingera sp. MMG026]|uniref:hypothetical protein n=1 Tax=Leisingera sp. MMG026 TaxID=2909982 RepID=UPI001F3DE1BD|nr:hypothetical protein [Leisingera sp. MMG026]MCF6430810.1 hypothetical protein [Leisingera sp. MMG026]
MLRTVLLSLSFALSVVTGSAQAEEKVLPSPSELSALTKTCLHVLSGTVDTQDLGRFGYKLTSANSKKLRYKRSNKLVSLTIPFATKLKFRRNMTGHKGYTTICELEGFDGLDASKAEKIIAAEMTRAGFHFKPSHTRKVLDRWVRDNAEIHVQIKYDRASGELKQFSMVAL